MDTSLYVTFYPGQYTPEEQAALDRYCQEDSRYPDRLGGPDTVDPAQPVEAFAMKLHAKCLNPENPLFQDEAYAAGSRYGGLVAFPGYMEPKAMGFLPEALGDGIMSPWLMEGDCYDHEMQYFAPIRPGDHFTYKAGKNSFHDATPAEGSIVRFIVSINTTELYNQRGELAVRTIQRMPNFYARRKDGRKIARDELERAVPHSYQHPAHHYTAADWDQLKALWEAEEIRGAQPRYFEDVQVGAYLPLTAEAPVTQQEMIRMHGLELVGCDGIRARKLRKGPGPMARETLDEYGVPNSYISHFAPERPWFYNFTGRNYCLRSAANWCGDDGWVRRINWRMVNDYPPTMQKNVLPKGYWRESYLQKVPGMEGKFMNTHGMGPDATITHGYVYDKHVENGEHLVELAMWCEDLDGNIHTECGVTVVLPSRA